MTSVTLLWMVGGALAVLIIMLAVLIVARSLDGSQADNRDRFAAKMDALAAKAAKSGESSDGNGWVSGVLAQSFMTLATASRTGKDDETKQAASDSRKQIKALFTGLAIAGGIILAIVGAVVGDGS